MLEGLFFLIIGWFFGIFSTSLSNKAEWYLFKKKSLLKAIKAELEEAQARFVLYSYLITTKYFIDDVDEKYRTWIGSYFKKIDSINIQQPMKDQIEKLFDVSMDEFKKSYKVHNKNIYDSTSFKRMSLPLLSTNISLMNNLDDSTLRKLLDILFKIEVYNEDVELNNYYYQLTFNEGLSPINREINQTNINQVHYSIKSTSEYFVKRIDAILDEIQ